MSIHVMVYACSCNGVCYSCNGVCLFICFMFSFVCTICESILEADSVVGDQNTSEDDPQDTFNQGKWIFPLHFCLYPNNTYKMFTFGYWHKFDGICLNRIT
jgi:hypothetical protein